MNKKQSPLKPQMITANASGLPRGFAVIETDDAYEAGTMAQEAFADPAVSLVVWSNAADIVPESLKQSVRALSTLRDTKRQQVCTEIMPGFLRSFFSLDDDLEEKEVKKHFSKLSVITGHQESILREWQENCLEVTCDLAEAFDAKSLKLATRFQGNDDDYDGIHTDSGLCSDSIRVIRVLDGDTTLYYASDDIQDQRIVRGYSHVSLKENAQSWTVRPWDFAFVSRNVAQQAPTPAIGFEAEARRVVEIYTLRGRHEFVAGARRPLRKTFSRLPQPD